MSDQELEAQLKRYRPVGPSAELRERVMGEFQSPPAMRLLQWCPAATAAIIIALFSTLAADSRSSLASVFTQASQERERRVNELAALLGGDVLAKIEAERIVELSHKAEGQ